MPHTLTTESYCGVGSMLFVYWKPGSCRRGHSFIEKLNYYVLLLLSYETQGSFSITVIREMHSIFCLTEEGYILEMAEEYWLR